MSKEETLVNTAESEQINSNTYEDYSSAAKHKEGETGLCIKKERGRKKKEIQLYFSFCSKAMSHYLKV